MPTGPLSIRMLFSSRASRSGDQKWLVLTTIILPPFHNVERSRFPRSKFDHKFNQQDQLQREQKYEFCGTGSVGALHCETEGVPQNWTAGDINDSDMQVQLSSLCAFLNCTWENKYSTSNLAALLQLSSKDTSPNWKQQGLQDILAYINMATYKYCT